LPIEITVAFVSNVVFAALAAAVADFKVVSNPVKSDACAVAVLPVTAVAIRAEA